MKRKAYEMLLKWKGLPVRKPLLLRGARQVGKTWLLKAFASSEYEVLHYFNFEEDAALSGLFDGRLSPSELVRRLELYSNKAIHPETSLIVFDEVQQCDRALNSLKYFAKDTPQFHVAAAGSLLGIHLPDSASFPVGKVHFVDVKPLSFVEFLRASGEGRYADMLDDHPLYEELPVTFHSHLIDQLRTYYYTGGMPEVVAAHAAGAVPSEIRALQQSILDGYELDFVKHSGRLDAAKISLLWKSIPSHLARENHKFVFSTVRPGARARTYEDALQWLDAAGLILRCSCAHHPISPLNAQRDLSIFKVYVFDTGLLSAMVGIEPFMMVQGDELFTSFSGALVENYIAQHLAQLQRNPLTYWKRENNMAEIDFLIERKGVIPIEVKAGANPKSKSLRSYRYSYAPSMSYRFSLLNFRKEATLHYLPLYAVHRLFDE